MAIEITSTVKRGKNFGTLLKPHRYQDGHYIVAKGGNTSSFAQKVKYEELVAYIMRGYNVRMSGQGVAASLYGPESLNVQTV